MSELLIELFSEEIPAVMQVRAEKSYLDIFARYFQEKEINFAGLKVFIGPRRITIYVAEIDKETKDKFVSIKGPRIDSSDQAVNGFCRANNINKSELTTKDVKGHLCYFYEKDVVGKPVKAILEDSLQEPIMEYVWPKSMHWSNYKIKWVRPLKNILCVFDGEVIPFKLGHLIANNTTFGHRFMNPKQITVENFAGYKKDLEENFVILEREERKARISNVIREKIEILNKKYKTNYLIKEDAILLEEVAGLAEYPVVLCGRIEDRFLELPSEVLVSSMRTHQKYFSLFQQTKFFGKGGVPLGISEEEFFAPFFLFVSNIKSPDDDKNNEDLVVKGNQKVLSARLSDALYFYQQDLKKPLLDSLNKLDKVVFHTKLGSMKQKTDRLVKLTKYITSDFQQKEVEEAALLCKGDLVSEMVGEFPELQGIMGYYYALKSGKSQEIASAIRDHYKPQGPSDNVPEGAAAIVAVADKIDSLCGLMLAGERATGSGDPFGLRRLALGIIRILSFENEKDGGIKGSIHSLGILNLVNSSCHRYQDVVNYKKEDENQIINFVEERYKHYLKEQGHTINQINAVIDFRKNDNLLCLRRNLLSLKDFLQSEDGERLLNSYKRINNILSNQSPVGEIDKHLFNKYEKDLFEFVDNESKSISMANFYISLKTISNLKPIIDSFFDNVMVMDSDAKIANNRLLLLVRTKQLFNKVANFDLL